MKYVNLEQFKTFHPEMEHNVILSKHDNEAKLSLRSSHRGGRGGGKQIGVFKCEFKKISNLPVTCETSGENKLVKFKNFDHFFLTQLLLCIMDSLLCGD